MTKDPDDYTMTQTHQEALLADNCTFPKYTQALHRHCARYIDRLEKDREDMAEVIAELDAALAESNRVKEKLGQLLPNNQEAFELLKGEFHSEEGQ